MRHTGFMLGILAMMAGSTALVYVTAGENSSAAQFYYIPVIISAFSYGVLGAWVAALVAGFLAGPYLLLAGRVEEPQVLDWVVRFLFFGVIGTITAILSGKVVRQAREFESLFKVAQAINSSLRLGDVLKGIVSRVKTITRVRAASIRLLDEEKGELSLAASDGLSDEYLTKGSIEVSHSGIDQEVLEGRVSVIQDVARTTRLQYAEHVLREGVHAMLCVPLASRGRRLGVFRVYSGRRKQFGTPVRNLVQTFANQAAIAIENAELYENLQRSYFETVRGLSRALEARDESTLGHSERVTRLLALMAEHMGFSRDEIDLIRFGGILHDIGKVGITEEALQPGTLLNGGADLLAQMHPLIGASILEPVSFLKPVIPMVQFHHEYLDGSGYPEGLAGKEIPPYARLAAAANVFDLVVARSAGNQSLGFEHARSRVQRMADAQLDAGAVEAILAVTADLAELDTTADVLGRYETALEANP